MIINIFKNNKGLFSVFTCVSQNWLGESHFWSHFLPGNKSRTPFFLGKRGFLPLEAFQVLSDFFLMHNL